MEADQPTAPAAASTDAGKTGVPRPSKDPVAPVPPAPLSATASSPNAVPVVSRDVFPPSMVPDASAPSPPVIIPDASPPPSPPVIIPDASPPPAPAVVPDATPPPDASALPPPVIVTDVSAAPWMPPAMMPGLIQREKRKQTRRKKGDPPGKPGKDSWVWGTKFTFFHGRQNDFLESVEQNTTGEFYTKLAKLYVLKYPRGMKDDEDLEYDIEDPPDEAANQVVNVRLDPGEVKARQDYFKFVRERIGPWYRGHCSSLLKREKATLGQLLGGLADVMRPKPRRPHVTHYYSSKYYDDRVEPEVAKRMKALERRAGYTGEKVPHRIVVQNEMTKECWDAETPEFQAEMLRGLNKEYDIALKGWRESMADGPSRTAEEFSTSLTSAAHYLQPFCEAIEEKLGMVVAVLLAGPIGDRGGRIEMRSIHSGKTRGLVEKDWPAFDPVGFRAVERSMVEFGHQVFTKADCDARKTAVQDPAYVGETAEEAGVLSRNAVVVPKPTASPPRPSAAAAPAPPAAAAAPPAAAAAPPAAAAPARTAQAEVGGEGGDRGAGVTTEGEIGGVDDDDTTNEMDVDKGEGEIARSIARCWMTKDRRKWSRELTAAHAAFERGRGWGIEWASCVERFYGFESRFGYSDRGGQVTTSIRPPALKWWIGRARQWNWLVTLGAGGGRKEASGYGEDWWKWWRMMQPAERKMVDGKLSIPQGCDWGPLTKLHGKNGLLQVMASLLWWGDRVAGVEDANPIDRLGWVSAVEDVGQVLQEMLRPGILDAEIARHYGASGKGKGKRTADEMEDVEGEPMDAGGGKSARTRLARRTVVEKAVKPVPAKKAAARKRC
ncbi:hypothetical protein C8R43DRAFT_1123657 [Mycena crocata]|nr:hypothetical protein C8R43DRAFT_1123657 [Mycena crocata]